jgi:hypothetical protein
MGFGFGNMEKGLVMKAMPRSHSECDGGAEGGIGVL